MRRPAKLMLPSSGRNTPAIMLKQVVLPAPFGPIRLTMPPSGTARLALVTARRPRKLFEMPSTTSRSLRSEEHTSELQSLMRISYAVFCLKKKKTNKHRTQHELQEQM